MLSVWDSKAKESMRIDLWTKEMPVDEMKIFFHQTWAMSDTFHRATGDEKMADTMKDFCEYFAEKLELKKINFFLTKNIQSLILSLGCFYEVLNVVCFLLTTAFKIS
jgi:uncharacterized protein involved in cysteine biosynthesis